jgi:hypothetical protein
VSNVLRTDGDRFLEALRAHFVEQSSAPRSEPNPVVWVNAAADNDGVVVLIYRQYEDGPLVGRRWVLDDLGAMFGTQDPVDLAEQMWLNEVEDPDTGGQHLAVGWAHGLVDDPGEVLWRGQSGTS